MTSAIFLKYWEISKVSGINAASFIVNILAKSGTIILRIWIFTQLYKTTYSFVGTNSIGDMSLSMVIWVLMFTQAFRGATRPGVTKLINEEIKSGEIAYTLNRPYSYMYFHYFGFLGRIGPQALANLIIGAPAAYLLVGGVSLQPLHILLSIVPLFFGYTLEFLISFIIGLSAFWIEDNSAFEWIYQKGQMVLGGNILPLSLFPLWLKGITEFLPFSQLFYGPSQLMVNFDYGTFIRFMSYQIFWLILFGLIANFLFKKGGKNVAVNGG